RSKRRPSVSSRIKLPKLVDGATSREGVTASFVGKGAIAIHEASVVINWYRRCYRPWPGRPSWDTGRRCRRTCRRCGRGSCGRSRRCTWTLGVALTTSSRAANPVAEILRKHRVALLHPGCGRRVAPGDDAIDDIEASLSLV